jgi:hypothetical protein
LKNSKDQYFGPLKIDLGTPKVTSYKKNIRILNYFNVFKSPFSSVKNFKTIENLNRFLKR